MSRGSTILDSSGRPMRRAEATYQPTPYRAGDPLSQEIGAWHPNLGAPDGEYWSTRDLSVARQRDLIRNSGWASGALTRRIDAVVGTNLRLSARPDWRALGLDAEWAGKFAEQVEGYWRLWADDPGRYCDAARRQSFGELAALAYRHRLVEGDAFAVLLWDPDRGGRYGTMVQIVDPDRVSNPYDQADGDRLRQGIELDEHGAAIAYHIRRRHPSDPYAGVDMMVWDRAARETSWGRPQVVHHFDGAREGRAGQTRGRGLLMPVVEAFKLADKHQRVELQAAILNAVLAAYVESPFDHEMAAEAFADTGNRMPAVENRLNAYQEMRADFHDDKNVTLGGVRIPMLFPGEKIAFHAAARPAAEFGRFQATCLRNIASAMGLAYEQVSQDWSQVNYSSARAALLEVWRGFAADREGFGRGFATPIYGALLEELIDRGEIELPPGAPDFYTAKAAYCRCRWIGPGRGWVDPQKERQAAVLGMQAGLSTLEQECAEQGLDWQEVADQRKREIEYYKKHELALPDWANVAAMGSPEPAPGWRSAE